MLIKRVERHETVLVLRKYHPKGVEHIDELGSLRDFRDIPDMTCHVEYRSAEMLCNLKEFKRILSDPARIPRATRPDRIVRQQLGQLRVCSTTSRNAGISSS